MSLLNKVKLNPKWLQLAESILVGAFFFVLWVLLARSAGGPVKSDELMYINHGLLNVKDTFVLNRYTHIYFQKLFMEVASTPYAGVQVYWGFLTSGSAALTYLVSRLATRSSSPIHAGLSTLLYLTIPLLALNSGNTAVDITAGFFLTLTVFVYILYFRSSKRPASLLVLTGLLFFLSFRTKETTLALVVLFAGLLFDESGKLNLRSFLKLFGFVLIGVLAGVLLLMLLNGIFLKDVWFGLRLSEIFKFKETYVDNNIASADTKVIVNWLSDYLFMSLPYIFIAYLLSGARVVASLEKPQRLPWLVPLMFIFILSAIIGFSKWGVVERHIFPALPLLCAFAPQLILHDRLEKKRDVFWLAGSILAVGAILVAGRFLLMKASLLGPYNYPEYLSSSIYPILLLGLMALVFLIPKYSLKTIVLPLVIFASFIRYPLTINAQSVFLQTPNVNKMGERLQVLKAFDDEYQLRPMDKILLFEGALYRLNYSSRYAEFIALYNMYFDARLKSENVDMTNVAEVDPDQVIEERPDFVLMSVEEFTDRTLPAELKDVLLLNYDQFINNNKVFTLFVLK